MPQPQSDGFGGPSCFKIGRCGEPPDRIQPVGPLIGEVQERGLTKESVLRYCLLLDDASLSWVIQQMLLQRANVVEQVVAEAAASSLEEKKLTPDDTSTQVRFAAEPNATANTAMAPSGDEPQRLTSNGSDIQRMPSEPESPNSPKKWGMNAVLSDSSYSPPDSPMKIMRKQSMMPDALKDATDSAEVDRLRESILSRDKATHGEPPATLVPVVQFLTSMCYCREEDPNVEVCVVRIGDLSKRSSVWYETRDLSAKAGVKP